MAFVLIVLGLVLVVAAIRGTEEELFGALGQDVPGYAIWAAAIVAVGVVGFVPGLKGVSRGLLALVVFVLILRNAQGILTGFQNAWQGAAAQGAAGEAAATGTTGGATGLTSGGGLTVLPEVGDEITHAFSSVGSTASSTAPDLLAFAGGS